MLFACVFTECAPFIEFKQQTSNTHLHTNKRNDQTAGQGQEPKRKHIQNKNGLGF